MIVAEEEKRDWFKSEGLGPPPDFIILKMGWTDTARERKWHWPSPSRVAVNRSRHEAGPKREEAEESVHPFDGTLFQLEPRFPGRDMIALPLAGVCDRTKLKKATIPDAIRRAFEE